MINRITTVVIPTTSKVDNEKLTKIKNLIQDSTFYLENITTCRYYPVPTIIVDEIPLKDMEQHDDTAEHDDEKLELNYLGVYFPPGYSLSPEFTDKLKRFGYNVTFINSLFISGSVALAYDKCEGYARKKHKEMGEKQDDQKKIIYMWDQEIEKRNKEIERINDGIEKLKDFQAFFLKIIKAVLIHEHAHAITVEGIDLDGNQLQYPIDKFNKNYADKIVCESIAEWACIHHYGEENPEEDNPIIHNLLIEHASNKKSSLLIWPYGGAVYLKKEYEKDKNVFKKIFDAFRKQHIGESLSLFLSDADDFVIKLFCAFKNHKNHKKLSPQIPSSKSILSEALKFIDCDDFFKMLIQHSGDVNGQDAYGDTPLMLLCGAGNLTHVKWLCSKNADLNKQNNNGDTALIFAGLNNQRKILGFLLMCGANPNVKNKKGKALIDMDISDEIKGEFNYWIRSDDEI